MVIKTCSERWDSDDVCPKLGGAIDEIPPQFTYSSERDIWGASGKYVAEDVHEDFGWERSVEGNDGVLNGHELTYVRVVLLNLSAISLYPRVCRNSDFVRLQSCEESKIFRW